MEVITRPDGLVDPLKTGRTVSLLPRVFELLESLCGRVCDLVSDDDAASFVANVDVRESGLARIKRCRSSGSSSASDSSSASNASANVGSASVLLLRRGSSWSSRRDEGEDEREWNEGGGESGMAAFNRDR